MLRKCSCDLRASRFQRNRFPAYTFQAKTSNRQAGGHWLNRFFCASWWRKNKSRIFIILQPLLINVRITFFILKLALTRKVLKVSSYRQLSHKFHIYESLHLFWHRNIVANIRKNTLKIRSKNTLKRLCLWRSWTIWLHIDCWNWWWNTNWYNVFHLPFLMVNAGVHDVLKCVS